MRCKMRCVGGRSWNKNENKNENENEKEDVALPSCEWVKVSVRNTS